MDVGGFRGVLVQTAVRDDSQPCFTLVATCAMPATASFVAIAVRMLLAAPMV